MDSSQIDKKQKITRSRALLSVTKETRKTAVHVLARVNKKDYGKRVQMDALLAEALKLIQPDQITRLQEASLSNADRFERDYRAYVAKNGPISKDQYLGLRMSGNNSPTSVENEHTHFDDSQSSVEKRGNVWIKQN